MNISFPACIAVVVCMLPVFDENFALFVFPCNPALIFCAPFTAVRPSMYRPFTSIIWSASFVSVNLCRAFSPFSEFFSPRSLPVYTAKFSPCQ